MSHRELFANIPPLPLSLEIRDAGTGVHHRTTAPLSFEMGGNGGTGALI